MSAKHTKGPWVARRAKAPDNTGGYDYAIVDSDFKVIAEVYENVGYGEEGRYDTRPAEANAEFIVRAVNSHDELVAELESAALALEESAKLLFAKGLQGSASIMAAHAARARAAISKATGAA